MSLDDFPTLAEADPPIMVLLFALHGPTSSSRWGSFTAPIFGPVALLQSCISSNPKTINSFKSFNAES